MQISEIVTPIPRDCPGPFVGCCEDATGDAFLRRPMCLIPGSRWIRAQSMHADELSTTFFRT